MREPCHIRNQQRSNGLLQTWKWPMSLGEWYYGDKVEYTEVYVTLSEKRKEELLASEERKRIMGERIHFHTPLSSGDLP
jgi:hypothetical protein